MSHSLKNSELKAALHQENSSQTVKTEKGVKAKPMWDVGVDADTDITEEQN